MAGVMLLLVTIAGAYLMSLSHPEEEREELRLYWRSEQLHTYH